MNNSQLLSLPQFKEIDAPVKQFMFDVAYQERPSKFAIEIVLDETTYYYEFSVREKRLNQSCSQKNIVEQKNYLKEHLPCIKILFYALN